MKQDTGLFSFIDILIDQRGYADASDDVREQLRSDLKQRLDEFVMTKTVSAFSKEELQEFERLFEENKPISELTEFVVEHIPDYHSFMTGTLVSFRDAYLS
jgi:Arc/MetJ-type ribon-helix-helix transcriptional regulator